MKNNFITKIIGATLAFAMMIGGAVGINTAKQAKEVNAASSVGTTTIELGSGKWSATTNGSTKTDSLGQTWTVSVTASSISNGKDGDDTYTQFGSSSKPCSALSFSSTGLTKAFKLTAFTIVYGGSGSGASSCATLKIDSSTLKAGDGISNTEKETLSWTGEQAVASGSQLGIAFDNLAKGTRVFSISYTLAAASSFGTLHHIGIDTPATKTSFEVGEEFSSSGLILTGYDGADEAAANTQTYTSGYTTDYDGHTFVAGDVGQKTVTVTYNEKTVTYSIDVSAVPDFTHTYANNSVFGSTSYSISETATHTPDSGPEYIYLGGYNYSSGSAMSLRNVVGMYLGNNEEYELESVKKNINRIVITTNTDVHDKLAMTEGPIALSEDTAVAVDASADGKTLTYDFSGENPFFKLKTTGTSYINMTSIKVYLGSNATVVTVIEVLAGIKTGTYMTGSTLSASDFDVMVTWSNSNVTEPTSGFTWTVRGIPNGTLIEGDNEVVITYQGVESDPFNVVGTSIHATAVTIQEVGPITLMVGGTKTLHATITPNNAIDELSWSSNNESVASVNDEGTVTGHAIGVATITATAGSVSTTRQVIVTTPSKTVYSLVKVGTTSGYAQNSDVTFSDGQIWNIPGNQTLEEGLKLGGNMKTPGNRAMYSKSAYVSVRNIVVSYGAKDSQITVNSAKLLVYSSAANANAGNEGNADEIVEGTYVENGTTTFVPSSGNAWESKYFRIVYNMSSTTTSNKGIILTQLALDIPNPSDDLAAASSIKTISGVESNEGATVTNVALRFGGVIPVSDWNTINTSWPITDFGVMFARGSMLTARSLDSLEKVFRNDPADVAMVHRGSVGIPNANGDDYIFTARLILEEADYDEIFYAAPFIVAGGEYYFLQEMHYSVRTLAEECLTSGESSLSQAALTTLKGNN